MSRKVALIEDESDIRELITIKLKREGFEVLTAENFDAFYTLFRSHPDLEVIASDIKMPGTKDGIGLLETVKSERPHAKVILITGHGDKTLAIQSLRLGASDYLEKPFQMEELVHALNRVFRERELEKEREALLERLEGQVEYLEAEKKDGLYFSFDHAPSMKEVEKWLSILKRESHRSSEADDPSVLILGETGTGKEIVARRVHDESSRAKGNFVAINCANLTETLLESELFGFQKGAFTGAQNAKAGLIEIADRGTLFLDEIGEMPFSLQAKILRVLQEKTIRRLGGLQEKKVDIRILAATHQDIDSRIREGRFREDLYHRLNQVEIKVPPLRQRKETVLSLGEFLFRRAFDRRRKNFSGLSEKTKVFFLEYSWPGNLREMVNMAERAALISEGSGKVLFDLDQLESAPIKKMASSPVLSSAPALDDSQAAVPLYSEFKENHLFRFERDYFERILKEAKGSVSSASRISGVDRSNLKRMLKKFGLGSNLSAD